MNSASSMLHIDYVHSMYFISHKEYLIVLWLDCVLYADAKYWIPVLCHFKFLGILLHGGFHVNFFLKKGKNLCCFYVDDLLFVSGLFLGRVHLYYQSDSNACAFVYCDWSLFKSPLHCLCASCKYLCYLWNSGYI